MEKIRTKPLCVDFYKSRDMIDPFYLRGFRIWAVFSIFVVLNLQPLSKDLRNKQRTLAQVEASTRPTLYKYVVALFLSRKKRIHAMASPSSLTPLTVPIELHVRNCEKLLTSIRHHLSHSSRPLHGFVLLQVIIALYSSTSFPLFYFHTKTILISISISINSLLLLLLICFREARSKLAMTLITSRSSGV